MSEVDEPKELTAEDKEHIAEARKTFKAAKKASDALVKKGAQRVRRYDELTARVRNGQKQMNAKLAELREQYLDGEAELDELIELYKERRVLADIAADLKDHGRADMPEWQRLAEAPGRGRLQYGHRLNRSKSVLLQYGIDPDDE